MMRASSKVRKGMVGEVDNAVLEALQADFGDPVEYEEPLSDEDAGRYEDELDDSAEAHAEAEAGLQDLSAG